MKLWISLSLFLFSIFTTILNADSINQHKTKNILVLLSYNISIPWEEDFVHGLQESIKEKNLDYELYFEVIDTERLGKYYTNKIVKKHLEHKYAAISFDAIIAESDRASLFLDYYQKLLTIDLPQIYYVSKEKNIATQENKFIISDNTEQIILKTAKMALAHNPNLEDIYVINGGGFENQFITKRFLEFFQHFPNIKFHVIEEFTIKELLRRIENIDSNSAVFYTLVFKDSTEKEFIPKDVLEELCKVSKAPVYSMYSSLLGSGTIGGHMMDAKKSAHSIIDVLNDYLINGKFDQSKQYTFSTSYIDYPVFQRFRLKETTLEDDIEILNQTPSVWIYYRDEILIAMMTILFLIIIVIYLLNQRNRQRYITETMTSKLLKKQQKEILHIKNRFQNMFLNHDAIMLLVNPDNGMIIDVNKSAVKFYGYTRSELKKMSVSKLNVLSSDEIHKKLEEAKELKHNYFEFPHRLKNGEVRIVEVHSSPIEVDGQVILFSILKDITKIKEYEINLKNKNFQLEELSKELAEEKTKYQRFMENSSDGILIVGLDGALLEYSNVAKLSFGYSDEEMKKLHVCDWDKQLTKEELSDLIDKINYLEPISFNRIHTRKDGSTYDAAITAIKIDLNSKQYVYASIRDITADKALQTKLEVQKQEFETIFNYAQDGITIIDLEENFINFNNAFLKLTDCTKESLFAKKYSDLIIPEDKQKNQSAIETAIRSGHVENFETTCIVKEGKRITVHVSISLLPDDKTLLLIIKDTSTLKLLEEQSKLASMGEMIGNIAHQWRQPLSIITSSASGLKVHVQHGIEVTPENIKEFSDLIVQQAKYLSKTIDNFRDFLKGDKNYEMIKLHDVIEYTLSLVAASIKNNNITLIKDIDESLMLEGSINELSEAFINIINNAKDVLKEKVEDHEDRLIFISAKALNNSKIELIFKDSGGGIDEKIITRIFEPYFTSKHKSIGTGLGLSMADKTIRARYNGSITAYNETYEYNQKQYTGACFKVVLESI